MQIDDRFFSQVLIKYNQLMDQSRYLAERMHIAACAEKLDYEYLECLNYHYGRCHSELTGMAFVLRTLGYKFAYQNGRHEIVEL